MDELDKIKLDLLFLINSTSNRLTVYDLEKGYYKLKLKDVPYKKYGHNNFYEFLLSIPESIKVNRSTSPNLFVEAVSDHKMNYLDESVKQQKNQAEQMRSECEQRPLELKPYRPNVSTPPEMQGLTPPIMKKELTQIVGQYHAKYMTREQFTPIVCNTSFRLDIEKVKWKKGEKYAIECSEVYGIDNFCFHLVENAPELNTMMLRLNTFYGKYSAEMKMLSSVVKPNMLCVCKYPVDDRYHRAIIRSLEDGRTAVVLYVDYGTFSVVPKNDICYLHKYFTTLPIQAIKGKLANVQPRDGEPTFDELPILFFHQLFNMDELRAELVDIDEKTAAVNMNIYIKVATGEYVSIRDRLIELKVVDPADSETDNVDQVSKEKMIAESNLATENVGLSVVRTQEQLMRTYIPNRDDDAVATALEEVIDRFSNLTIYDSTYLDTVPKTSAYNYNQANTHQRVQLNQQGRTPEQPKEDRILSLLNLGFSFEQISKW